MSKIYLRLTNAPDNFWERRGVLRFTAEVEEGKRLTAWAVLCRLLNVSSATANKALTWMHGQGIIGYFAGKNGVGLRIFLNRAVSSVGIKPGAGGKKILDFSHVSSGEALVSRNEIAFNETFGKLEKLDLDKTSCAPINGADDNSSNKTYPDQNTCRSPEEQAPSEAHALAYPPQKHTSAALDEIVSRLKMALEPSLHSVAVQAAKREHERTREWLENRGLPKAARVAQREAFNVLRQLGVIKSEGQRARMELVVGQPAPSAQKPKVLTAAEINEAAEICVSMLEAHGQAIDVTLAEIGTEAGGYLLTEDAQRVCDLAISIARQRDQKE